MPKFRLFVNGMESSVVWHPARVRQQHWCRECRREIGRGSIAYRPVFGGCISHRVCAVCAMQMLQDGRAHEYQ